MKHPIHIFPFFSFLIILLFGCMPKVTPPPQIETKPVTERYSLLDTADISSEISRITSILTDSSKNMTNDSQKIYNNDILSTDLFVLHTHPLNPSPDYRKARELADYLSRSFPERKLHYLAWVKVLSDWENLLTERDSLKSSLTLIEENSKGSRQTLRKKSTEIDSLSSVIKQQAETIKRLQLLDVQMERQRREIK